MPRARRDYTKSVLYLLPALSALAFMRRRLPGLAAGHLGEGRVDAVMVALPARDAASSCGRSTTPAASSTCGPSTTPTHIRRLEAMGVDAVITNDPRLFAAH